MISRDRPLQVLMIAFIMTGASGVPIVFNRLRTLFNRLRKGVVVGAWHGGSVHTRGASLSA